MPFQTKQEQIARMKQQQEQLRAHLMRDRTKMSATIQELTTFCQTNLNEDPLVYPVKENPFKDKRPCSII